MATCVIVHRKYRCVFVSIPLWGVVNKLSVVRECVVSKLNTRVLLENGVVKNSIPSAVREWGG